MRKIACWTERYTEAESIDLLREFALSHALRGGVQGLKISRLIRRDDLKALCEFELDFRDPGWDPDELYHCRQAVSFFTKLEELNLGIDRESAARKSFNKANSLCRETNEIFRKHARGEFQFLPRVEVCLYKAQRQIARMMGPVPSWEQLGYRFGKGATTLTKKRVASAREKLRVGVACSEELLPAAKAILGELPALCSAWASAQCHTEEESWYSVPVQLHDGRLEFVPKNYKTYRATVTEPPLNGLGQLAVGDHLVERFVKFGLDLRDQSRNQRLALEGSLTAALATADQTSASDCEATELVAHLLPLDWFIFLSRLRTGHVLYRGERIKLEMFSSMGNGFTFPLESVVFYALACSVCEPHETVSVYGDDIIVPTHRFDALAEILRAVGFIPNEKKSYSTGPFRESCGKDYYKGIDVRPYFQKDWVSGETLFTLHNYYKRRGAHEDAARVLEFVHPDVRQFGPDGYGDGHLIGDHPMIRKDRFGRNGWEGTLFNTYTLKGRKDIRPQLESDWVLPLYTTYRNAGTSVLGKEFETASSENLLKFPRGFYRTRVCSPLTGPDKQVSKFVGTHRLRETTPTLSVRSEDGSFVPAVDLPLLDKDRQYHKVSIYTLGR